MTPGARVGIIAAGATADLDDCGTIVERVVGNEGGLDRLEEAVDGFLQLGNLGCGLGGHLGALGSDDHHDARGQEPVDSLARALVKAQEIFA